LKLSSLAASNPSCTADSQSQGLGAEEGFGADSSSAWALQQPVDSGAATGFCDSHAHNGLAKTNIMHTANTLWHQTFISNRLPCLADDVKTASGITACLSPALRI
jgi:hypothetical protein